MPAARRLLAIDTSTELLSLAVCRDGPQGRQWRHESAGGAQASAQLIPALQDLLRQADLRWRDLDALVFGRGPGSFTGLRTACSVVQGLALGAGLPVLPVDTLMAVAESARLQQGCTQVLAVLDARMGEVYAAALRWHDGIWTALQDTALLAPQALPDWAEAGAVHGPGWTLAGNAWDRYGAHWPATWTPCAALPGAAALLQLAPALLQRGAAVPADQALPLYVRDKVAQTTAERAAARPAA